MTVIIASPDSIKAALGVLADTDKNRKVAILGDVLEMGDFAKRRTLQSR